MESQKLEEKDWMRTSPLVCLPRRGSDRIK